MVLLFALVVALLPFTGALRNGVSTQEEFTACLVNEGTDSALFFPRDNTSSEYTELNFQWNTHGAHIEPLGYLVPKQTLDIKNAILCGREVNIRVVTKSGGHSYEKYSFGDSDSIVIDLRELNSVQIAEDKKTVRVGSGTLMGPLYWSLWTNGGLSFSGTVALSVGVGGVSMGGGIGFFTNRFGLTLDTVLEVEMVDAEGVVRVANETSDVDLFWALRGGGGGNFGIVTSFKYSLFEASELNVTAVSFSYTTSMFKEAFKAWQSWRVGSGLESQAYSSFIIRQNGDVELGFIGIGLSESEILDITSQFPEPNVNPVRVNYPSYIEIVGNSSNIPLQKPEDMQFITRQSETLHPDRSKSYFGNRLLTDEEIEEMEPWLATKSQDVIVVMVTVSGRVNEIPRSSTAFVHRGSLYQAEITCNAPDSDTETHAWVDGFDELATRTFDSGESYQNIVDGDLNDNGEYLARYYGANLQRLVEIKAKVDPQDYFRFPQSIPTELAYL